MAEVIDHRTETTSTTEGSKCLASTPTKTRRFRSSTQLDLLLCKSINEKRAHVSPMNKKTDLINEACALFISVLPQEVREKYMDPKRKTCSDHFNLLVSQRRKEDMKNRNASGIFEKQTELNQILDDLILQRDEVDEVHRKKRDSKTVQDKKLDDAAKQIRSQATSRMSRLSSEDSSEYKPERKKLKVVTVASDDEEIKLLKQSITKRRKNERKKMEIDRERLELDKEHTRIN